MNTIVVGIDGSDSGKAAFRFALDEARAHGAKLKAIAAWHVPSLAYSSGYAPLEDVGGPLQANAARVLEEASAEAKDAGVEIETAAHEGLAAPVLLEEAEGADLLVVGSRGHGGFTGLLLGSVSQECAHHSSCPIAIIRGPS